MNLTFNQVELAKLNRIRAGAKTVPSLQDEIKVGKAAEVSVFNAVVAARDAVDDFLPSEVLADGDPVEAARLKLDRAEFKKTALSSALRAVETRCSRVQNDLRRDVQELANELKAKIKAAFPSGFYTEPAARILHELGNLPAGDIAACAKSLLIICQQLGAELPEESA